MGRFAEAASRFDRALLACPHGDVAVDCRERRERASSVLCAQARAARAAALARGGGASCGGGSPPIGGGVGGAEARIELSIPFAARGGGCDTRVDSIENVVADAAAARRALCLARATARQRAKGGTEGAGEGGDGPWGAEGAEEDSDSGDGAAEGSEEGVEAVVGGAGGAVGVVRLSLEQLAVAGSIGGKLWDASLLRSSMVTAGSRQGHGMAVLPSLAARHRSRSPLMCPGRLPRPERRWARVGLGAPPPSPPPRPVAAEEMLLSRARCYTRAFVPAQSRDAYCRPEPSGSPRGLASTRHASRRPPPRRTCRRLVCSSSAQASRSPG